MYSLRKNTINLFAIPRRFAYLRVTSPKDERFSYSVCCPMCKNVNIFLFNSVIMLIFVHLLIKYFSYIAYITYTEYWVHVCVRFVIFSIINGFRNGWQNKYFCCFLLYLCSLPEWVPGHIFDLVLVGCFAGGVGVDCSCLINLITSENIVLGFFVPVVWYSAYYIGILNVYFQG